jgi:hypothetical protein
MQVTSLRTNLSKFRDIAPPVAPDPTTVDPLDTFETIEGVSSALTYKFLKMKAKMARKITGGLSDQAKVELKRPMVCVQGFRSKPGGFKHLLDHLTQDGKNGGHPYYVKGGQFFLDVECEQPVPEDFRDPEAKIFRVLPHDRLQSFEVCADQLAVEMKAIEEFTGERKPDVLAHSMGGLSVRRYLDKYPVEVGKLVMLGTPHLGTKNADFGRRVLAHDIGWAISLGGLAPAAAPAIEAIRAIHAEENANPFLEGMNQRWAEQEKKTDAAITFGGKYYETPTHGEGGFGEGDALVETAALQLPGAKVKILDGHKLHHTLPTDDGVFQEMTAFFGWEVA